MKYRVGFLTKFRFANGYETIFVFRENEGRVSRNCRNYEKTSFAKHENRENEENLKWK